MSGYSVRFHCQAVGRFVASLDEALDLIDARYPRATIGVWEWRNRPLNEIATIYRGRTTEPIAVAYEAKELT